VLRITRRARAVRSWPTPLFSCPGGRSIIARMRRIRVGDPGAPDLIEALLARDAGMPVRAIERLLTRGEAGLGMLILAVRKSLEAHRCPGFAHWGAVGLGEVGDADAVPDLALLMRLAWRAPAVDVGFSAAEAIGKMGATAEEVFLRAASRAPRHEHYWFHYAAACLGTARASDFVLSELECNRPLTDSAALAIAILGRADALPVLDRALRRAKPWQLPMLAEAVRSLHRNESPMGPFTRDWRVRYRYQSRFGRFPPLLPCLTALLRSHPRGRIATTEAEQGLPRSVDGIIERDQRTLGRAAKPCGVCGATRARYHTGVVICDDCAPAVAHVQADCLLAVDCRSNDIFDVLNTIDNHLMDHDVRGLPDTERYRRYLFAQSACHWVIEQRVDSVAGGAAMLLARADVESDAGTGEDAPVSRLNGLRGWRWP
jgi:hypothetical protein